MSLHIIWLDAVVETSEVESIARFYIAQIPFAAIIRLTFEASFRSFLYHDCRIILVVEDTSVESRSLLIFKHVYPRDAFILK